jgi:hypothetical protein
MYIILRFAAWQAVGGFNTLVSATQCPSTPEFYFRFNEPESDCQLGRLFAGSEGLAINRFLILTLPSAKTRGSSSTFFIQLARCSARARLSLSVIMTGSMYHAVAQFCYESKTAEPRKWVTRSSEDSIYSTTGLNARILAVDMFINDCI